MDNQNLRAAILKLATDPEARANFEKNPEEFAADHNLSTEEVTAIQDPGSEEVRETRPRIIARRYSW